MLLRTIARPVLAAVLSCTVACDPCKDEPGQDDVVAEGFELYDLSYPTTGGSIRIFHDGDGAIHLLNVEAAQLVQEGQVRAMLTPEALVVLNAAVTQLESGADLGGGLDAYRGSGEF